MVSSTSNVLWYVYGIVPASLAPSTMPSGLDDAVVGMERGEDIAALVSTLHGAQYEPEALETSSGDVDWLSPRAVAHDRVLTWASDLGPVVPLPMFSLFSGRDAVCTMLRDKSEELSSTLARLAKGREYALRVYRVDVELLESMSTLSPRLAALEAMAAAASPGQRYLLGRKLDTEKKNEMRAVTQGLVDEVVTALNAHSLKSARSPIPRAVDADGPNRGVMILNAAFLVSPNDLRDFQQTLTSLVERHASHGLRFDFTGPWPPYHFANQVERGD